MNFNKNNGVILLQLLPNGVIILLFVQCKLNRSAMCTSCWYSFGSLLAPRVEKEGSRCKMPTRYFLLEKVESSETSNCRSTCSSLLNKHCHGWMAVIVSKCTNSSGFKHI